MVYLNEMMSGSKDRKTLISYKKISLTFYKSSIPVPEKKSKHIFRKFVRILLDNTNICSYNQDTERTFTTFVRL